MCFFGGGPKPGDAYASQRQAERERQARIDQAVSGVNQQFDAPDRASLYDQVYDNALQMYLADIAKQRETAQREAGFAVARSGGAGGSQQAFANSQLDDLYNIGVQRAQSLAEQARSRARSADEDARANLIQLIYGGLSATDAQRMALNNLRSGGDAALNQANFAALGDVFGSAANILNLGRLSQGGAMAAARYGEDFANNFNTSPGSGYGGRTVEGY